MKRTLSLFLAAVMMMSTVAVLASETKVLKFGTDRSPLALTRIPRLLMRPSV